MNTDTIAELGFNAADWLIVAVVLISGVLGLARGFIKEALSIVVLLAAVFFAMLLAPSQTHWFESKIALPSLRYLAAFATIFIGTLLAGSVVGLLAGGLVKLTGIGALDKLLGLLFGGARGVLLCLGLLMFVSWLAPVKQDPWWREAKLIAPIMQLEEEVTRIAKQLFTQSQAIADEKRKQLEAIQDQRSLSTERKAPAAGGTF